ncbi:MAG: hypothetical protein HY301_05150 [Verrucomicrobia bacterium]|nr:hypothetical protein [Verrucomicrobiota bacterium]
MRSIQEYIHAFEEGSSKWIVTGIFVVILFLGTAVAYDLRVARNFASSEPMDAAQLGRNIAEGKGFVTENVRPLSMWLLKQKATADGKAKVAPGQLPPDLTRIQGVHPDVANAPFYPLVLAGYMNATKALAAVKKSTATIKGVSFVTQYLPSFEYDIDPKQQFMRYQPDFLIHIFNQALFALAAVLVFRIGRRMFEPGVGWLSAIVFLGSDLMWRFSTSGLSTMLLIVIFLMLVLVLLGVESQGRVDGAQAVAALVLAAMAGTLLGLGALTRYSFGWLAIPAVLFVALFGGPRRLVVIGVMLAVMLALLTPWLARNYQLSGTLFGTSGFALVEGSGAAGLKMERSLDPKEELDKVNFNGYRNKLLSNIIPVFQEELPKVGGSMVSAFFLVGLLLHFRNPALGRLRIFLLMALAVFIVVQALGRTHLSEESPEVNSENLLVLLAPLVFVYGVGMFYLLLDQTRLPVAEAKVVALGAFAVVVSLPLLFGLARSRTSPIAYPPYYPPYIQLRVGNLMEPGELVMSDIPAGMAWYGRRQCVGFTFDMERDFFGIHDYLKPVKALYLTPVTIDGKFHTQFVGPDMRLWGIFFLQSIIQREVPARFPLRAVAPGFFPAQLADQLLITDRERWKK